ncbi:MAG: CDP-alcohol phosphatidyltransferase family protein [Phycisphaeraceae bacterium]
MAYRAWHPDSEQRRPAQRSLLRRGGAARRTAAVLPTLLTLGNGLSGFMAIFLASRPADAPLPFNWTPLTFAALFIFLGMIFDGLDGMAARLTRSTSDLGGQLDSMSDMVTFGVAPAFLAVQLVLVPSSLTPFFATTSADNYFGRFVLVVAMIYVACTALRLARFNVETKSAEITDHLSFKGLPSPGAAGTVASMVLLHEHYLVSHVRRLAAQGMPLGPDAPMSWSLFLTAMGMVAVMLLAAMAMVSRLRYIHVTNRYMRGRRPFRSIVALVVCLLLVSTFPQQAVAGVFVLYALSAPCVWLWHVLTGRRRRGLAQAATDHRRANL